MATKEEANDSPCSEEHATNCDCESCHGENCHCEDCHDCVWDRCDCECDECDGRGEYDCDCDPDEECGFCTNGSLSDYCGCEGCLEGYLDDGTLHVWDRPGVISEEHESAYAKPQWLLYSPVPKSLRQIYDHCNPSQLRSIIHDRGLGDPFPRGLTLKYYYIRALEAAGGPPLSFPFMHLPSAARILVYKELLNINDCGEIDIRAPKNHTAILRCCKAVYREAIEILYSSPTICCMLNFLRSPLSGELLSAVLEVKRDANAESSRWFKIHLYKWPDFLRRIHQIRVNIKEYPIYVDPGFAIIRSCLKALVAFLKDGNCLKRLEISFDDIWCIPRSEVSIPKNYTNVVNALAPVRQLQGLDELKVTGRACGNFPIDWRL